MVVIILNACSIAAVAAAAELWFWSASVRMPIEITSGYGGAGGSVQELGAMLSAAKTDAAHRAQSLPDRRGGSSGRGGDLGREGVGDNV